MDSATAQLPNTVFEPIRTNRRTSVVWTAFVASITLVGGFLILTDPSPAPRVAAGVSLLQTPITDAYRTVFDTAVPVARERWLGIVIDHTGHPHGSIETLSKEAQSQGLEGLNHHFVIGNGNGMGDGQLHVGYRWSSQVAAVPVAELQANVSETWINDHAIRIALIGNGDNRGFTGSQMKRLSALVAGLQRELGIPDERIQFVRDLTDGPGPGSQFDYVEFERLLREASSERSGG